MNDLDGEVRLRLEYDLQFFAKDGPGGEKTEAPTAKKLNDARKEGQVAKSKEIITALMLLALFVVIKFYIGNLGQQMIECFSEFYDLFTKIIGNSEYGMRMVDATGIVSLGLTTVLNMIVPFIALAVVIAILGNALQQKWMVTTKPLQPKFSKISPLSGLKRMFNVKQLFEVGKSIAMIAVMCYVIYTTVKDKLGVLYTFYNISLYEALEIVGDIIVDLGIKISAVFLVIGFVDLIYQRHKFKEDMKMTKQEIKDEFKNTEGDPQVKGQIRRRMQQVSRRRMMEALPQADVVITNPTHFAVALKYEANKGQAPVVIAKGADYLAFDIKAKAKECGIEIVENKPLARILYNNVEIGAQIPPELYQAVAEVLAFVYSLKNNYNMDEGRR
ncbi:MAG: flagellar biosynthesis protein FlhB [[Bacteroides] pectinophilus]|nr:flagellar biosynthesis protein FlhB [[Bacteroides] pectinophilus]